MIVTRRAGTASATTLFGLALTVVVANAIAPRWVHRTGLDIWNLPAAMADERRAGVEFASLNAQEEQLRQEIQLSDYIALEMADGKRTLKDAVAEMEPILKNRDGFVPTLEANYHTTSLREGVARFLIERVRRLMVNNQTQLKIVLVRLEGEFDSLKREG